MRKILVELQLQGDDEEAYEGIGDELTADDFLLGIQCDYSVMSEGEGFCES